MPPGRVVGPASARAPEPGRRPLLVNLSGGVDSLYATWRLLSDGYRLVVHHCVMRNSEGRADVELDAVTVALAWLRRNRLRGFDYVQSGYDHGTLGRLPYDVEVIGFFTGVILRDPARHRIKTVVVSANASDPSVRNPTSPRIVRRRQIAEATAGRKLEWWIPYGDVTKQQMVEQLPDELLAAAWWCRRPAGTTTCGRCRPCREVTENPRVGQLQLAATEEVDDERRATDRATDRGVRSGS